jgi:galactitol-specific phosphotransferase system IIC component
LLASVSVCHRGTWFETWHFTLLSLLVHAAAGATTAITVQVNSVQPVAVAKQTTPLGRKLSAAGIPVTVLQSVAVVKATPPAVQATVQLRGMRAAAFDAQSTQQRFRQAVVQVLLHSDPLYYQV